MAATVKRDGIRKRRFQQSSTKHALSTPYNLQWPGLRNGDNKVIIDQIVRTLEPLHFKQLCTRKPKTSAEDDEETAAKILDERKERAQKLEKRSSFEIGLNQVTRALEKGTLKLVLVDRSIKPPTMLEHLLVLCATRKVAACALSGLRESTIPSSLGVPTVAAFGFKNTDTPTLFDELIDFIKQRIPPLYVPWLHTSKENSEQSATENPAFDATNQDDSDDEHLPGIEELHDKKKRRRTRKRKENSGKLNKQTVGALAIDVASPKETTVKPTGTPATPIGTTGRSTENTEMQNKRKRRKTRKRKENSGKLNTQSVGALAIDVASPKETTVKPAATTGTPTATTGSPTATTGTSTETTGTSTGTTGTSTEKPGKLMLTRGELLEVFGTADSAPSLQGKTASKSENKEKKKRKRKSKKNKGKKKNEPPVKLVYLRPSIKSFDAAPKDKGDQIKIAGYL